MIRREGDSKLDYSLSTAPADTTLERLAWLKCQRYFVERTNEDSKSEVGWDELQAQKYRAWEHHLALTTLATWYITETKPDWERQYPRNPLLLPQFETEVLPALSAANVRTALRGGDASSRTHCRGGGLPGCAAPGRAHPRAEQPPRGLP